MCGIVGYIGNKKASPVLIEGLLKLEYRGYDSAGIATLENNEISVMKDKGRVNNLYKLEGIDELEGTMGIAHTRWATNGKDNLKNCHPHLSKNKDWAIVHNGIIENYLELKNNLKENIESETDTAVIAECLAELNIKNIFEFIDFFKGVEGGFAIVAINKRNNNCLYLAKRKNPLYISKNEQSDILIASDPICFNEFSKKYYSLEDDEFAIVEKGNILFFDKNGKEIIKNQIILDEFFEESKKESFSTYMLKEIYEEGVALKRQVEYYQKEKVFDVFDKDFLQKFDDVLLIGCGTAYHACMMGAKYFQKILNVKASAEIASEFIYETPKFITEKTLAIFISQSGETADTLKAFEIAKKYGATCLSFTNVSYSTLAKKSDINIPICAGIEIAVASTKAYICQLSALFMFVNHLFNINNFNKIN